MAKSLKLKVKNTQLAEALKISKIKKEEDLAAKKTAKKLAAAPKEKKVTKIAKAPKKVIDKSKKEEVSEKKPVAVEPILPKKEKTPVEKKATPLPVKEKPKIEKKVPKKSEPFEELKKREKESIIPEEKGFRADFARPSKEVKARRLEEEKRDVFDSRARQGLRVGEEYTWRRRKSRHKTAAQKAIEVVRPKTLNVRLPISVKDLAHAMKLKASELISKLFLQGVTLTINDFLDDETTVQLLGHEFDCEISIDTSEEERLKITAKTIKEEIIEAPQKDLEKRAPVITFMGHVDHGKTSLIDAIRKSNLVEAEAGAITQHIGAFKCHREKGDLVILDTPGHEAFTLMRKRGVTITDIVVLVIAGDEGIMPQTEEALKHAKEADVPIIVAINKCDKPAFNPDQVYRQLADHELLPEAWGGSTITVNCSAVTKEGIPELLEMLLLQAELLELKANPNTRARGSVLESQLHKGFGVVATVLVQNGTLKLGDALVFDQIYGRIKTMHDEHGKLLQTAAPSTPVKITGLSDIPEAGCEFIAVKTEKEARKLCEERLSGEKRAILQRTHREGLEALLTKQKELAEKKVLNLILRADVQGSVEAIKNSLLNIPTKKVELIFISEGVGEISESDIELAKASNAVIIGFHTQIETHAEELIKRSNVVIKKGDIIYQVIDDVKKLMLETLDKIRQEREVGTALVKKIFRVSQLGVIAGCQVSDGIVKRGHFAKLFREGKLLFEGNITSLKREKEDMKEVGKGLECGILLEKFNDIQEGDEIKTYDVTFIQQQL